MIYKPGKYQRRYGKEQFNRKRDDTIKRTYNVCFNTVLLVLLIVCIIFMVSQKVKANDVETLDIVEIASEPQYSIEEPDETRRVTMGVMYDKLASEMRLDPGNHTAPFVTKMQDPQIAKTMEDAIDMDVNLCIEFEGNSISLDYDDHSESYIATIKIKDSGEVSEQLKDCSFFRDSDNNIVVYGFSSNGCRFEKYTLDEDNSKREILFDNLKP